VRRLSPIVRSTLKSRCQGVLAHCCHNIFFKRGPLYQKHPLDKKKSAVHSMPLCPLVNVKKKKKKVCSTYLCLACPQSTSLSLCSVKTKEGESCAEYICTPTSRLQALVLHPNTVPRKTSVEEGEVPTQKQQQGKNEATTRETNEGGRGRSTASRNKRNEE